MAVVSRLPAPYREPLFQRISDSGQVDIHVLYQYRGRPGTAWGPQTTGQQGFDYSTEAFAAAPKSGPRGLLAFFWAWRRLSDLKPHLVVIHGYSEWINWAAILFCWQTKIPYALRSDSNLAITSGGLVRKWIKGKLLSRLVRRAQSILYIGTANRNYWESFGATSDQLLEARYAVDETRFVPQSHPPSSNNSMKFLFVGRLIDRKRVRILLDAFKQLCKVRNHVQLTIVGTGPQTHSVTNAVDECGSDKLVFLGQRPPDELPSIYAAHDVLVCPYEREPWGLTINEAMSCGLAVIASTTGTCGAAVDLLSNGVNGIGLANITPNDLADAMTYMADNRDVVATMKGESLRIIQDWNYESAVKGFIAAAHRAVNHGLADPTPTPLAQYSS